MNRPLLLAAALAWIAAAPAGAQDSDAQALLDKGYAETDSNRAQALADFTRALSLDPHSVLAYCQRGYVYSALGKYAEAVADYDHAIQLAPNFSMAYVNRGINQGLAGHAAQEIADESRAIELDPGNPEAWFARAQAWFRQGQFDRAIADYDHAIDPGPPGDDDDDADGANRSYTFTDSSGSVAIAVNVDGDHLYYFRGLAYLKAGQPERALADFNRSVIDEPTYLPGYTGLADSYDKEGQPARAAAEYDRLVAIDPRAGLIERGNYYGDHGNTAAALADFQRALALDPQSSSAYNARAWMLATACAGRDGHAALADATKACQLSGWSDFNSLDTLAAACAETGDFDSALKWQAKALAAMGAGASSEDTAELQHHLALYQQHHPFHRQPGEP